MDFYVISEVSAVAPNGAMADLTLRLLFSYQWTAPQ